MFIFKVLSILLLAFLANGTDLDGALSIMACAQKAIIDGVPELGVPSHSPVVVTRNYTWKGDIGVASASLFFHDFILDGIPDWNVTGYQISRDNDSFAVFDYKIHWDKLVLNGSIDANFTELALKQNYNGTINTVWKDVTWKGSINVTKPNTDVTSEVNDFTVIISIGDSDTKAEDFGVFESPLALAMDWLLPSSINSAEFSNSMSENTLKRLNSFWWSTGNIWKLVDWCIRN